jgi:hypothetical protein
MFRLRASHDDAGRRRCRGASATRT